jgi:fused signal recognition particle receptor
LQKTKENFFSKITKAIAGKSTVDDETLDSLEEALVGADVGIDTTVKIIERIEARVAKDKYLNTTELINFCRRRSKAFWLMLLFKQLRFPFRVTFQPYIILVVGVNGVGKTTTIGKLAYNFKTAGKNVLLVLLILFVLLPLNN